MTSNRRVETRFFEQIKRRLTPQFLAFTLLAGATAFSFQQERKHSSEGRQAIIESTSKVLHDGCVRGNSLRIALRTLISQQRPVIEQYVKSGKLTRKEGDQAQAQINKEIKLVPLVNCTSVTLSTTKT